MKSQNHDTEIQSLDKKKSKFQEGNSNFDIRIRHCEIRSKSLDDELRDMWKRAKF